MGCNMIPYINDTSGFYKLNPDNTLLFGRIVEEWNLNKENHNQHEYPVGGWYWFDHESVARSFFNLPEAEIIPTFPTAFQEIDPLVLQPQYRPKYNV